MSRPRLPLRLGAALLASALLMLAVRPAAAGITATAGAVSAIAHPTGTLNSNTLENSGVIYTWFERKVTNPGSLSMDHVGTGTVNSGSSANAATISPGFALSYMIHYDQTGTSGGSGASGSITFSGKILGVWFSSSSLGGSDAVFTPAGLTYGSLTSRGYELGSQSSKDRFNISVSGNILTIQNTYTSGATVDQMRVLVSPEPGTVALMGLGVLVLCNLVRRRRAARRREAT